MKEWEFIMPISRGWKGRTWKGKSCPKHITLDYGGCGSRGVIFSVVLLNIAFLLFFYELLRIGLELFW